MSNPKRILGRLYGRWPTGEPQFTSARREFDVEFRITLGAIFYKVSAETDLRSRQHFDPEWDLD
jgi:hypothetical protein